MGYVLMLTCLWSVVGALVLSQGAGGTVNGPFTDARVSVVHRRWIGVFSSSKYLVDGETSTDHQHIGRVGGHRMGAPVQHL